MSEFSFHKNVSASAGVINFCHISGGGGEGASKKYLMRLGGVRKNFVTQIVDILPETTTLTGT